MKESELKDNFIEKRKLILFSKFSIFLISIITSPLLGGLLYCANLRYSGQKRKIFGTYIAITISNLLVSVPFFEYKIFLDIYNPTFYINKIVVGLLMIFPFWNVHFKDLDYKSIFPWIRIFSMISMYGAFVGYHIWQDYQYSFFNPAPIYLPRFNILTVLPILFFDCKW